MYELLLSIFMGYIATSLYLSVIDKSSPTGNTTGENLINGEDAIMIILFVLVVILCIWAAVRFSLNKA